ncbi:RagB/SusD family nutrient uptake outer membrane protein [Pedobacter frigoris]|uniref:RagB/SusD family nutrient uptake outer membrane protein n=1 Tax=Pedobacter frigoris TaxID=2571272 RepID=UPI00292ED816|nr:RagB/SusD family nutrient uptake outer membrane protein [Pedobacter frigoris]
MKNYIIIALLLSTIGLSSCKKYLDLAPNENIQEDQVFSTIIQAEYFANNVYSTLPTFQTRTGDGFTSINAVSDEAAPTFWNNGMSFNRGGYSQSSNPIGNIWANSYRGIRKANILLERLPDVPTPNDGDPESKIRLRAEALFCRAFLYFDILKFYGAFPIVDKRVPIDDPFQQKRNTYDECVAFMVKDLDEAAAVLPDFYSSTTTPPTANMIGRATKGMCLALKSRLLLYAASPLNTADNSVKWQKAADAAKAVIALNRFPLYNVKANKADNYKDIFNVYANSEIIWYRDLGNNKNYEQAFYPPGLSGWANTVPTQNLVDEYQMANGKDITDPTSGYDPANPYLNREPRFYASIWYNGSVIRGYTIAAKTGGLDAINGANVNTTTGYYTAKFCDGSVSLTSGSGRQTMSIWFRIGEMYLNYAEAANEANTLPTNDPLIYTYMNLIRNRAGIADLPAGLTKEDMRKAIRRERRVELAFEEHRFFDDRRWKLRSSSPIFAYRWNAAGTAYTKEEVENRPFEEKMWYMPIPQTELDILRSVEQNLGWK